MNRPGPVATMGPRTGLTLLEAMVAILILGLAVGLFQKLYGRSWATFRLNTTLMRASQVMERHVEAMRIHIASDTSAHWPPRDTTWSEGGMNMTRLIAPMRSPRDGANLPNVRQVSLVAVWGLLNKDTLEITTCVSKRF